MFNDVPCISVRKRERASPVAFILSEVRTKATVTDEITAIPASKTKTIKNILRFRFIFPQQSDGMMIDEGNLTT